MERFGILVLLLANVGLPVLVIADSFKIGFLPAMTDKAGGILNEGASYAGAIEVALKALRNDSRYNHLNFSYIYQVSLHPTLVYLN